MMKREKVGVVEENEKNEVQKIYEKKMALSQLFLTLKDNSLDDISTNELYERIVDDLGKVEFQFQQWWKEMQNKYNWKSSSNRNWMIDFKTNEIFCVKQ